METVGQMLLLAVLMLTAQADTENHLLTFPQSQVAIVGSNFTATCVIVNTTEVTADDLYWNMSGSTIPREQYTRINNSALSVTFTVTSEKPEWLLCLCSNTSPNIVLNQGRYMHGIYLVKGYYVQPPVNLFCVALQEGSSISDTISCEWSDLGNQTEKIPTTYTLYVKEMSGQVSSSTTRTTRAQVSLGTYPNHMTLEIWVKAENSLGTAESEHLSQDAGWFVKTNPPSNVSVISEQSFATSLLLSWTPPIHKSYVRLRYRIRYAPVGDHTWIYLAEEDMSEDIQSFRLQNLQPFTLYNFQVSCKNVRPEYGYWSEWSNNVTRRTPEARPRGEPDVWSFISQGDNTKIRDVQIVCKEPLKPNGRIIRFDLKLPDHRGMNGSMQQEMVFINSSITDSRFYNRDITVLKRVLLPDSQSFRVSVSAVNSVGQSAAAFLGVPERARERPPVEDLRVWSHDGRLMVEWKSPRGSKWTEFVVEWVGGGQKNWQRETWITTRTNITGPVERCVFYTVSVYAVWEGWRSRAASVEAFLEEGAPNEAPLVRLNDVPGHTEVHLVWDHTPPEKLRGFITTYTIYYRTGAETRGITVPGNTSSYVLTSLSPDTTYDIWIQAATVAGVHRGPTHSFTTQKYAPGEIEGIVVGVSLGLLFLFLMTVLLCFYKKDVIKENLWPQIPDPGQSTIRDWSPDYPLKADLSRESCMSGISVLDVDVCDGRSMFDEEKAGLPLKKDKFLSEEHSSGIGGSSCMSSPRQSVSDSDEGGDMAETTASTVQYSSVVASSGYKGQTPAQPPPTLFSRSESTQPLLECEENPDTTMQEGSRQSQRCGRLTGNSLNPQLQGAMEEFQPPEFCSLQEDSESSSPADDPSPTPASSYMPQQGGYRPQ